MQTAPAERVCSISGTLSDGLGLTTTTTARVAALAYSSTALAIFSGLAGQGLRPLAGRVLREPLPMPVLPSTRKRQGSSLPWSGALRAAIGEQAL